MDSWTKTVTLTEIKEKNIIKYCNDIFIHKIIEEWKKEKIYEETMEEVNCIFYDIHFKFKDEIIWKHNVISQSYTLYKLIYIIRWLL